MKNAIVLKLEPHPSPPPQGFPNTNSQVTLSTISHLLKLHQPKIIPFLITLKLTTTILIFSPSWKLYKVGQRTLKFTFPQPIFAYESLSSSSSSPTCSTAAQEKSSLDLSWHDLLLDDAFLPANQSSWKRNHGWRPFIEGIFKPKAQCDTSKWDQ